MTNRLSLLVAGLVAAGCGGGDDPDQARLERGMAWAVEQLHATGTNPMAAASFREIRDMGGTLVTYVTASMADNADMPPFASNAPISPWSVVLRQLDDGRVVVEGYGESLSEPMAADTVTLRLM